MKEASRNLNPRRKKGGIAFNKGSPTTIVDAPIRVHRSIIKCE
jgi:hypothetical protein